ncbi:MAG: LysM peptidoglycan-binding domain-containing protein, partial [Pseudomonadota bacterium]
MALSAGISSAQSLSQLGLNYAASTIAVSGGAAQAEEAGPNQLIDDISVASMLRPSIAPKDEWTAHTVEAGETLYSIAQRFGLSVDEAASINRLYWPYTLSIGEVLLFPTPQIEPTATETQAAAATPGPIPSPPAASERSGAAGAQRHARRITADAGPRHDPKKTPPAPPTPPPHPG